MSESLFARPAITAQKRRGGVLMIWSTRPLDPYPVSILQAFRSGSLRHPDRVLVAERKGTRWDLCTWGQARTRVDRLAQGLLNRGVAGRPILILSHNSIAHLMLTLAAQAVSSPVVPVSVAYSLQSADYAKLRHIVEVCDPIAVFAEDRSYAAAVKAIGAGRIQLSATANGGSTPLDTIEAAATPALDDLFADIDEHTIAKIMFTSGSTGLPKGVINTHGMLSANQQQIRQALPLLAAEPPVLLDWLPWSHTFGGNHNINMVLANGGSYWIDDGRPNDTLIARTVDNLADVQPTAYFNVPAGYATLIPILERDPRVAKLFFARLRVGFFASAALPQQLWDRMQTLAEQHGSSMCMTTAWGMTETAPAATVTHFQVTRSDSIGLPLSGIQLKLVPAGTKYELRLRGPNVTPGFYRRPDLQAEYFDSEGFLRTGDLVSLAHADDPNEGLIFEGRLAENFKLATGTFVSVGTLRPKLLSACAGVLQDAVICGHNGAFVSALVWLHPNHAHRVDSKGRPDTTLRAELTKALGALADSGGGSSERVERLLIMTDPLALDSNEITDKGYINQRAVRENRADLVAELTAAAASKRTICRLHSSTTALR